MYGNLLKLILYGITLKECFGPKVSYGETETETDKTEKKRKKNRNRRKKNRQ